MNKMTIPEITILAKKQPPIPPLAQSNHNPFFPLLKHATVQKEEFPDHEGYWIASHSSCGSKSWEQFKAQMLSLPEIHAYMAG